VKGGSKNVGMSGLGEIGACLEVCERLAVQKEPTAKRLRARRKKQKKKEKGIKCFTRKSPEGKKWVRRGRKLSRVE